MSSFTSLNGYEVEDAKARTLLENVEGKTIVVFGDSIAKGDHSNGGVWSRLQADYNVTIHNYAQNGAVMCDGVHTYDLSAQVQNMIDANVVPDVVVFMFTFNEISNAASVMTTANSIGFPKNNDRNTSIGNLEYWINYFLTNYKESKMCFVRYPIKIAQNERSFFLAQFDYSLYLLCEIYSIPICNMKNAGIVFDENATYFTSDGLHFNSLGVDKFLYPFIKGFLMSGMSVKNEEPPNCIGLYGEQTDMQNYIAMLKNLANVYGKKDFARTFDGLWFYTKEDTTDTTVRFGHLRSNFNQLYGAFGEYCNSDGSSLTRFGLYGTSYGEQKLLKPLSFISGAKTANLKTASCTVASDGAALKFSVSLIFDASTNPITSETIGTHTCCRLFDFNSNDMFAHIPKGTLKKVGNVVIGTFSDNQAFPYGLGLLVNEDNSAALFLVDGSGNYPSLKSGGGDIVTLSGLVSY